VNLFATKDTYTKTGADPLLTVFDANMIEKNVDQNTNEHLLSPAPNAKVNAPNNGPGLPIHVGDANGPFTIFDVNENEIDADENNTIPLLTLAPDAEVNAPNNGLGLPIPVAYANGADHPINVFDAYGMRIILRTIILFHFQLRLLMPFRQSKHYMAFQMAKFVLPH